MLFRSVLMLGWGLLGLGFGVFLLRASRLGWLACALGLVFVLLGLVQWTGLSTGARDPWAPLAHFRSERIDKPEFTRIKTSEALDKAIAASGGRPVMLDFYADWCVSCKEMEKLTFTDPAVSAAMGQWVLLQADVTVNDEDDKTLLKRFGLFGPPGIIFFDAQGRQLPARVIGYQKPDRFLQSLQQTAVTIASPAPTLPSK